MDGNDTLTANPTGTNISNTDKYLISDQTQDLRNRVSVAPRAIGDMLNTVYTKTPSTSKDLIEGITRDIYTYDDGLSFVPILPETNIGEILTTTKQITDYADKNGGGTILSNGSMEVALDLKGFLGDQQYTPQPDGSYRTDDKVKVYNNIRQVLSTPVRWYVSFKSTSKKGGKSVTRVIDSPLVLLQREYDADKKTAMEKEGAGKPPDRIIVTIPKALVDQMRGFKEGNAYYPRNLLVEPKYQAVDYKHNLQGANKRVADKLAYEFNQSVKPVRYYKVEDFLPIIGGREWDRKGKLIKCLNMLESRGELVKEWGFAVSRHKRCTKDVVKSPLIWVNHEGTPTYEKAISFYKKQTTTNSLRLKTEQNGREIKAVQRKIEKIEREL